MAKVKTTAQNNHNIGNASTIQVMQLFFRLIFKFTALQARDWNPMKDLQRGRFIEVINPSLQRIWCQGFNSTTSSGIMLGKVWLRLLLAICAHNELESKGLYLMRGNWYISIIMIINYNYFGQNLMNMMLILMTILMGLDCHYCKVATLGLTPDSLTDDFG